MPDRRCSPLVDALADLAGRFHEEGWKIYAVGGSVRDCLDAPAGARRAAGDIDATTDAPPDVIQRLVEPWADAIWLQGKRFGTIGARRGPVEVEITTHRREEYDPGSRKPVVVYGAARDGGRLDLRDDLDRRDFTVNAMAVPLAGPDAGTVIDPHGGQTDLAHRVLRTPLAPEVAFDDDPLRMLRAARFVASLGLEPVAELYAAATAMAERLAIVSAERIRDELCKLLVAPNPAEGLRFLHRTGLLRLILPELVADEAEPEARFAMARVAGPACGLPLAGLYLGLPTRLFERRALALRLPGAEIDRSAAAHRAASELLELNDVDAEAMRRWAVRGFGVRDHAFDLARRWAVDQAPGAAATVDAAHALLESLAEAEDLADLGPPVSGDDVMAHLGIEPGPEVGRALAMLVDARLARGPLTVDEALGLLDEWASAQ